MLTKTGLLIAFLITLFAGVGTFCKGYEYLSGIVGFEVKMYEDNGIAYMPNFRQLIDDEKNLEKKALCEARSMRCLVERVGQCTNNVFLSDTNLIAKCNKEIEAHRWAFSSICELLPNVRCQNRMNGCLFVSLICIIGALVFVVVKYENNNATAKELKDKGQAEGLKNAETEINKIKEEQAKLKKAVVATQKKPKATKKDK
jgi:hypothetical protein